MAQKKTSTKTKVELIEENDLLKKKVKELLNNDKSLVQQSEGLDKLGFSISKDGDGFFVLDKLLLDGKKYQKEEIYRNKDKALALYEAKKFLVVEMLEKAGKDEK